MLQAVKRLAVERHGDLSGVSEADLAGQLSMAYAPSRICSSAPAASNASATSPALATGLHRAARFTQTLWPDFDRAALDLAIDSYRQRERRFGRTTEQLGPALPGGMTHSPAPVPVSPGRPDHADSRIITAVFLVAFMLGGLFYLPASTGRRLPP